MMRRSIRWRLLLPLIGIVSSMIILLIGVSYTLAKNAMISQIDTSSGEIAANLAEGIATRTAAWKHKIEILASTDIAKTMDWRKLAKYASERSWLFEEFSMLYVADASGSFLTTTGASGSAADRPYFAQAMAGNTVVSAPQVSRADNTAVMAVVSPIRSENGHIIGMLGGVVQLSYLADLLNDVKIGESGYVAMLDQNGLVIAHPDPALVLTANMAQHPAKELAEVSSRAAAGETGVGSYTYEGLAKRVAYHPVPDSSGFSVITIVSRNEALQPVTDLLRLMVLVGILALAAILVLTYATIGRLVHPLTTIAKHTALVADGDLSLTIELPGEDEVARLASSFQSMTEGMRGLITQVSELGERVASSANDIATSAKEVGSSADQVAHTVNELAKGATEQSSAALNGSALVNGIVQELGGMVGTIVELSSRAELAKASTDAGRDSVSEQRLKMRANIACAVAVGQAISVLDEKSKHISEIIDAMGGIAQQTNLLALNAAIEAARAGEQGRGFAVVAEEVRKLADKSTASAKEVATLVGEIQRGVANAVAEMQTAKEAVDEQQLAVSACADAFESITDSVLAIGALAVDVSGVAQNLNEKTAVVGERIEDIAAIVQQAAAGTEEVAASTEEQTAVLQQLASEAQGMSEYAARLLASLRKFRV